MRSQGDPDGRHRRSLEADDRLIDELWTHGQLNPGEVDCLPTHVLVDVANRTLPFSDPAYDHVVNCSPCWTTVRQLQASTAAQRHASPPPMVRVPVVWSVSRRLLTAALFLLAILGAAWQMPALRSYLAPRLVKAVPREVAVVLDLGRPAAAVSSVGPSVTWPRARLQLSIRLPDGAAPGTYEVQLLEARTGVVTRTVTGVLRRGMTSIDVPLDLESVATGTYHLLLRNGSRDGPTVLVTIP